MENEEVNKYLTEKIRKAGYLDRIETSASSGGIEYFYTIPDYLKESEVLTCPLCSKKVEQDHNSFTCHNCRKTWPKGFDHENQGE